MQAVSYQRASTVSEAIELLSNGESERNDRLNAVTHAAWTMVALSILNLDETITQE